jgi:NAD(P)-dependent dehydrogenase (short-subunit alcohol dehydrogenase family)
VPDLRGRRCLITGAASGIGRATYELAMRRLNDRFTAVARDSAATTP